MLAAYVIVTVVTIAANGFAAFADFARLDFILVTMKQVGVPESWLKPLGLLKGAGVVGLLIGLAGLRPLGVAAAIGLTLFFIGAVVTHVRSRVIYNVAVPGSFLALAIASMALAIAAP